MLRGSVSVVGAGTREDRQEPPKEEFAAHLGAGRRELEFRAQGGEKIPNEMLIQLLTTREGIGKKG